MIYSFVVSEKSSPIKCIPFARRVEKNCLRVVSTEGEVL